jgi:Icc-related predicted phosphoesterase
MRLRRRGGGSGESGVTRLFFCTDLHGSEICFRKFLSAGRVYNAAVVLMGGDCTGKMVIPIIHANGTYRCSWSGGDVEVSDDEKLAELENQIKNNGLYPVRMSPEERDLLAANPDRLRELFHRVMVDTLTTWLKLAEERLAGSGVRMIVTPGNDDELAIDEVIESAGFIEAAEGRVTRVDDRHEMLSLGWSNETPWETPRECSEEELAAKIASLAEQIEDMENAIFNIHVPPYGTGLDDAPELADATSVRRGGSMMKPVGSTAVRDAILTYQPLLSLHGHIHESRGSQKLGRTLAINPGSSYSDWSLQGVIVDLADKTVARQMPTTG